MFPLRKNIEDSEKCVAMLGLSVLEFEEARRRSHKEGKLFEDWRFTARSFLSPFQTYSLFSVALRERTSKDNPNGILEIVAQSKASVTYDLFCRLPPDNWSLCQRNFFPVAGIHYEPETINGAKMVVANSRVPPQYAGLDSL
nr:hypothetical protein [Tanacetum cinerariifolium]